MPANRPYPGENPVTAQKRIAKNKVKKVDSKTKSDMMAANISSTIKNMGYQGLGWGLLGASQGLFSPTGKGKGKGNR